MKIEFLSFYSFRLVWKRFLWKQLSLSFEKKVALPLETSRIFINKLPPSKKPISFFILSFSLAMELLLDWIYFWTSCLLFLWSSRKQEKFFIYYEPWQSFRRRKSICILLNCSAGTNRWARKNNPILVIILWRLFIWNIFHRQCRNELNNWKLELKNASENFP